MSAGSPFGSRSTSPSCPPASRRNRRARKAHAPRGSPAGLRRPARDRGLRPQLPLAARLRVMTPARPRRAARGPFHDDQQRASPIRAPPSAFRHCANQPRGPRRRCGEPPVQALAADRLVSDRRAQKIEEAGQSHENKQAFQRPGQRLAKLKQSADRPAAAAPAPTSSVPTRIATLSSVITFVQLIGAASAKCGLLNRLARGSPIYQRVFGCKRHLAAISRFFRPAS